MSIVPVAEARSSAVCTLHGTSLPVAVFTHRIPGVQLGPSSNQGLDAIDAAHLRSSLKGAFLLLRGWREETFVFFK